MVILLDFKACFYDNKTRRGKDVTCILTAFKVTVTQGAHAFSEMKIRPL